MDEFLNYEFPVSELGCSRYAEMFVIPVCCNNEPVYYVLVAGVEWEEAGDAIVISPDSWKAIINDNEGLTYEKILEGFSVYDYFDIEPV